MSGFSFTKPFGEDHEEAYSLFLNIFCNLVNKVESVIDDATLVEEVNGCDVLVRNLKKIKENKKYLVENFECFFLNNKEKLSYLILGKSIFSYMRDLDSNISEEDKRSIIYDLDVVCCSLENLVQAFNTIKKITLEEQRAVDLIEKLENQVEKATQSVQNIYSAKLALESNKTDKVYRDLSDKFEDEYETNNEYFRNSLIISVCLTILSVAYTLNTPINQINWAAFISVKILIVAVGITLCTLFLRRSAHAKKLHEKAYQTHVEINAFPIFIKSLKEEDQQEITKELALRYFGNDIDQTQNNKIGDLIQDQLSAGTELIRASVEMVKTKQSESKGR